MPSPGLPACSFRPEYHADWMQKSYYRQVPLSPLGPEAIRELLDDLLGQDRSISGLAERIHERTAGNPFFTEEVVQSLIEAGNLEGTRGSYRLVTPVAELAIPDTVHSILAARIDRLSEREKQVLQTAAVLGKEFQEPILEEVVELPRPDLSAALAALKGGEFIYEQSLYPVAEYAFKHPLTQDVALRSQLRDRRRRIHAAVARAIEKASGEKLDAQAALLAHHWEEADENLEASRWHWRAAVWAGMSHASEMTRHLRAVWELLRAVPESDETLSLRVRAAGQMLTNGLRTGVPFDELEPLVEEGQALVERSSDDRARVAFIRGHGVLQSYLGRFPEGIARLREASALADRIDDAEGRIGARSFLVIAFFATGPAKDALRAIEEALELCGRLGEASSPGLGYDALSTLTAFRGSFLAEVGRIAEGWESLERALARAREIDDLGAAALTHLFLSRVAEHRGDRASALAHAQRGFELSQTLGTPNLLGLAYTFLGRAHVLCEEWNRATDLLEEAAERTTRLASQRTMILAPLALCLLRGGAPTRALAAAENAVEGPREMGARLAEVDGHLALAQVLIETQGVKARERIDAAIARAAELADETGAVIRVPRIHLARAALAGILGDERGRERELREAHRLYVEMGATGHADRLRPQLG